MECMYCGVGIGRTQFPAHCRTYHPKAHTWRQAKENGRRLVAFPAADHYHCTVCRLAIHNDLRERHEGASHHRSLVEAQQAAAPVAAPAPAQPAAPAAAPAAAPGAPAAAPAAPVGGPEDEADALPTASDDGDADPDGIVPAGVLGEYYLAQLPFFSEKPPDEAWRRWRVVEASGDAPATVRIDDFFHESSSVGWELVRSWEEAKVVLARAKQRNNQKGDCLVVQQVPLEDLRRQCWRVSQGDVSTSSRPTPSPTSSPTSRPSTSGAARCTR